MNYQKPSRSRKFLANIAQLFLILGLWLGGTYIFELLNSLHIIPSVVPTSVSADVAVDVWWPTDGAKISGLQPFKAMVKDKNVSDYTMFWQVDGGQLNVMNDSSTDYPHKEVSVDMTHWNWRGSGPYQITFKAFDKNNTLIGQASNTIYLPDAAKSQTTVVAPTPAPAPASTPTPTPAPTPAPTQVIQTVAQPVQIVSTFNPRVIVVSPSNNASLQGTLSFRAMLDGESVNNYSMYWQVDNGQHNPMQTNGSGKEASVNVSGWSWRGSGPYKLTFGAEKNGVLVASADVMITIGNSSSQTQVTSQLAQQPVQSVQTQVVTTPVVQQPVETKPSPVVAASGNPLSGLKFFVNPNSNARAQVNAWASSRPQDAAQMEKIAASPEAVWLGAWSGDVGNTVRTKIGDAKAQGAIPVFIAYNIPNRDCGQYSAGGVADANAYSSWISQIASGISGGKAVVVLEPDGLALTDCLSGQQKTDRFNMISNAVSTLKNAGAIVYIDAGHPNWISASDMASRLNQAGIAKADGFALNTSNFYTTADNISYGSAISSQVSSKHFVIDTARNGNGPDGSNWCNPAGRALGARSTTNTGNSLVDAFLWLKNPGESDGNCNGGPSAGVWWPDYALGLAKRAAY